MTRFTIHLPTTAVEELRAIARREDRPMGWVARKLVVWGLRELRRDPSLLRRAVE